MFPFILYHPLFIVLYCQWYVRYFASERRPMRWSWSVDCWNILHHCVCLRSTLALIITLTSFVMPQRDCRLAVSCLRCLTSLQQVYWHRLHLPASKCYVNVTLTDKYCLTLWRTLSLWIPNFMKVSLVELSGLGLERINFSVMISVHDTVCRNI